MTEFDNDVMIISDLDTCRLLCQETRLDILDLLKEKDMTASEISKILKKDRGNISRHMNKMVEKNIITVRYEKNKKNTRKKLYSRDVELILLTPDINFGIEYFTNFKDFEKFLVKYYNGKIL